MADQAGFMMRMHRKNRIIGQFAVLLLAVGLAGWWVYEIRKDVVAPAFRVTLPEVVVDVVEVPPAELKDRLRSTLQTVERLPEQGVRLADVDATLVLTPEELAPGVLVDGDLVAQDVLPSLSLLFFNHRRFAVLDGRPFQEGEVLQDGRIIRVIDDEGVTLEWPLTAERIERIEARIERIPWVPPLRVELKRPVARQAALATGEAVLPAMPGGLSALPIVAAPPARPGGLPAQPTVE
jgi:hypothetical protein